MTIALGLTVKSSGNSVANPVLKLKTRELRPKLTFPCGELQEGATTLMTLMLNALNMLTVKPAMAADGRMVRFSGKNAATLVLMSSKLKTEPFQKTDATVSKTHTHNALIMLETSLAMEEPGLMAKSSGRSVV